MRFLITGANGFIGQLLCKEMLSQGWQVRAAVRASCEFPVGVEAVSVGAIDGETNWADALRDVDVVIHLAARVHVMEDAAADPLAEFLRVNLQGTDNLARQAAAAGVKRLVYVSSIKVNGERTTETQPFVESDQLSPQDAYAISKWRAGTAGYCAGNRAGSCHCAPAAGVRSRREREFHQAVGGGGQRHSAAAGECVQQTQPDLPGQPAGCADPLCDPSRRCRQNLSGA